MNENLKYQYSQGLEYSNSVVVTSLTQNILMPHVHKCYERVANHCKKMVYGTYMEWIEYYNNYTQNEYILGLVDTPIGVIELAWIKSENEYFDISLPYFKENIYTWYPLISIPDLNNTAPTISEFLDNTEDYPNAIYKMH